MTTDSLDLLAALTDSVGRWGDTCTEVQWNDAEAILNLDGPRRHWIGRAKGFSKSRDVAALSVVALLTQFPPGAQGYIAASDAEQAGLLRQSMAEFVNSTPELQGRVTVDLRKVSAPSGATLTVLAADSAGAHGLRPYWLVLDEIANWPDTPRHRDFYNALWAGLPKVSDSRGIIITTAGAPSHFSKRIFDTANAEKSWRCSDIKGPPPWVDPDEVAAEQRRMWPSEFQRYWQNEWCSHDDSIADPDDVDAACILAGPIAPDETCTYTCSLDLGVRSDRTVACIAHSVRAGDATQVIVDRLEVWTPTPGNPVELDNVRLWLTEMCRSYKAKLLYDPSQAYLLIEQIRKAGIRTEEFVFSSSSVGKLATAIMQALRGRTVLLPDDDELRQELLAVRLRETSPNVMRIDTVGNGHDDRVIAVAMATYDLTAHAPNSMAKEWIEQLARDAQSPGAAVPEGVQSPGTQSGLLSLLQQQQQPSWSSFAFGRRGF
jgi:hypothetical protein